jgi:hypothetical protein
MARKRGFVAADPTAWKAIGWADKELAKKEIRPKAKKLKRSKIAAEGREKRKVYTYIKSGVDAPQRQNLEV